MALMTSLTLAADYSKLNNDDLAKLSGKVEAKDSVDYYVELYNRMENMTKKELREFKDASHEAFRKNTEKLSMKEFREKMEAIHQAIKDKLDSFTKKECKEDKTCHALEWAMSKAMKCDAKPHKDDKKPAKEDRRPVKKDERPAPKPVKGDRPTPPAPKA